ncbi:hypothetical protein [Sphingosinicella sp.]|uniref:hypothetical protein n=1 Tax=Sphingosinicella sp. TaxID=1917971 RepID=UPI004037A6C9
MKPLHKLCRRSFLARVAGGAVVAGGPLALVGGEARAQITDRDPTDPVGRGRGGGTGITDTDSGVGADPAGRGRGGGPRPGSTGVTDSDPTDPVGRGRGGTGITDSDSGPYADPRGRGRGGLRGPSESSPYDPAQRDLRCDNNRRLYAELSRDGPTPDTWSEGQLRVAQADYQAVMGARTMQEQNPSGDPRIMDQAWAIVSPIAQRWSFPLARYQPWYGLSYHISNQIYAAINSPVRAERLRQLQQARTNLAALGC